MISTFQHWQDLSTLRPGPSVGKCMLRSDPPAATVTMCKSHAISEPLAEALNLQMVPQWDRTCADPHWSLNMTCSKVSGKGFYILCWIMLPISSQFSKGRVHSQQLGRGLICLFWWPRVATRYLQDGLLKLWVPLLTTGFPNKNEQLRIILGYSGVPQWLSKPSYCPNMYVYELFTHLLYI